MQITVFGASGRVGRQVVNLLLDADYAVVAFIHNQNPFEAQAKVKVVRGSITDQAAVSAAITGSQAVISTLGSWGTPTDNVVSTGTIQIVKAMTNQNLRRLITVSGASAFCSQDSPTLQNQVTHGVLALLMKKILLDGEEHLRTLEASSLDWTCIRSPAMTGSKSTAYSLVTALASLLASVPRRAVAQCLVDQIKDTTHIMKAPVIRRG